MDPLFWKGYQATLGAICAVSCIGFLIAIAQGTDDSDKDWLHRSGATIVTDNLTGCQYLKSNGLTPRLDRNGKTDMQTMTPLITGATHGLYLVFFLIWPCALEVLANVGRY